MAVTRTSRETWVAAGLAALAAGGPDAVRVEGLSRTLGVSKGGFYWQFGDRRALLEAMLDSWEKQLVDDAIATVDGSGGDGRARLRALFALASSNRFPDIPRIELAIRDWARREEWVAIRLRRVDDRRMVYMRSLFGQFCADSDDIERRCFIVMVVFIGSPFVAAGHGGRTRAQVVGAVLDDLLR